MPDVWATCATCKQPLDSTLAGALHTIEDCRKLMSKKYHCEGCGVYLDEDEVEPYGESLCHIVPMSVGPNGGYWEIEPQPCGPVIEQPATRYAAEGEQA